MKAILTKDFLAKTSVAILIFFFVIFYFGDGFTKIMYRAGADFYRFGLFIKAFACLIVVAYGVITLNRSKLNYFLLMIVLTIFFLIGQYFLGLTYDDMNFAENANTNFKYLFIFIFFLLVIDIKYLQKLPSIFYIVYQFILSINGALIFIGMALKIDFLNTYNSRWRFGYDGLILAQNEASFIYIIALTVVYYRRFYLGKKEWFFWIVFIPSILVATKAIYLYIVLLFVYHVFVKLPIKHAVPFLAGIGLFGYLIFSSTINKILINSYEFFMYIYKRDGLWYALLSGRNQFIDAKLIPLINDHWKIPNFLFGGQDVISHYIEMGLFDLLLFYGIIGTALYLYAFYFIMKMLDFNRSFKIFFTFSFFLIIATAGHFFESGIAGIHFIMLILICGKWSQKTNENFTKQNT